MSSDKLSATSEPSNKQHRTLEVVQEALREVKEKCQAIINNIEDGYYEVDLAGNYTFFNDAMARIIGYTRDERMISRGKDYPTRVAV